MTHFIVVTPFVTSGPDAAPRLTLLASNIFEIIPNVLPNGAPLGPNDFGCTIKFINGSLQVCETMEEIVELANGAKVQERAKRAASTPQQKDDAGKTKAAVAGARSVDPNEANRNTIGDYRNSGADNASRANGGSVLNPTPDNPTTPPTPTNVQRSAPLSDTAPV